MRTLLFLLLALFFTGNLQAQTQAVLITVDDARPDDLRFMPEMQKLLERDDAVSVEKAFVSCPLCCPSRATLMTGLYATSHGVLENLDPLSKETIFQMIKAQKSEIKTGIIGKYLNSHDGSYRSEFDLWSVYQGGMIYDWFNFEHNVNGKWTTINEYAPDYYLKQATEFVDEHKDNPYLLYLHFTAPHFPAQTPRSFKYNCSDVKLPKNFNKVDITAPARYQSFKTKERYKLKKRACKRARSLAYLDTILPQFIKKLADQEVSVIFVSDNGFMLGDYKQYSKNLPYEQVIRSFFLGFNHPDLKPSRLTSFTDITAEYYKLFGITPSYKIDGIPFNQTRPTIKVEMYSTIENKIPFVATVDTDTIAVTYENGFKQDIPY